MPGWTLTGEFTVIEITWHRPYIPKNAWFCGQITQKLLYQQHWRQTWSLQIQVLFNDLLHLGHGRNLANMLPAMRICLFLDSRHWSSTTFMTWEDVERFFWKFPKKKAGHSKRWVCFFCHPKQYGWHQWYGCLKARGPPNKILWNSCAQGPKWFLGFLGHLIF